MTPQRLTIAESSTLRNSFQLVRRGGEFCLSRFRPQAGDKAGRRRVHLLREDTAEVAIAHSDASCQCWNGKISVEMF
jgi:hypothetical protein